jgi:hypothetical protein
VTLVICPNLYSVGYIGVITKRYMREDCVMLLCVLIPHSFLIFCGIVYCCVFMSVIVLCDIICCVIVLCGIVSEGIFTCCEYVT